MMGYDISTLYLVKQKIILHVFFSYYKFIKIAFFLQHGMIELAI